MVKVVMQTGICARRADTEMIMDRASGVFTGRELVLREEQSAKQKIVRCMKEEHRGKEDEQNEMDPNQ